MELRFTYGDQQARVRRPSSDEVLVSFPEGTAPVTFLASGHGDSVILRDGTRVVRALAARDGVVWIHLGGRTYRVEPDRGGRGRKRAGSGGLTAPMPGQVLQLLCEPGATVEAGQPLLVLEAMKMQLEIKAPDAGRLVRYLTAEGEQVPAGAQLVELEPGS